MRRQSFWIGAGWGRVRKEIQDPAGHRRGAGGHMARKQGPGELRPPFSRLAPLAGADALPGQPVSPGRGWESRCPGVCTSSTVGSFWL